MKKYFLYLLLALIALPFVACTNDDETLPGEGEAVPEREFMTMFRKDHNTNKGDDEPYACQVKDLNDAYLYWYGVHGCAGYQIQASVSANVTSGAQGWADAATNNLLILDTIVGPEVLSLVVKDLEYSTDYRFAIRTLSHKGEGYHSKWYGHGDGRHWADWFGLSSGERYPTPEALWLSQITKTSFRVNLERAYDASAEGAASMPDNFEIDADNNFVMHYLTITPSPTNPNAQIDAKWARYELTEEVFARGYVDVDGLEENSVYVVKAVNKNIPVFVDAVYNTLTPRTDGTPGEPIHLKWDEMYNQNDTIPGANDYKAAFLDQWLIDYTNDNTLAEGTIFYLDGGKNYYFYNNPTLCKGFTLATNPEDLAAGKGNANVFLGGIGSPIGESGIKSCNFMFGRQPQSGEGDAMINVKALKFENINFDCPLAQNFGDMNNAANGTGNYFANMYSNGMGVNFASLEIKGCTFQRMIRGFIRVQGSKRKVFDNMIIEDCIFVNCGYFDNKGQGYGFIAGDGASAKSNIYGNTIIRNNLFYETQWRRIVTDNGKQLNWPAKIQYRITVENNTFVNWGSRNKNYIFDMKYLPAGSVMTARNNLFIGAKQENDTRAIGMYGMNIEKIIGVSQDVTFDVENNYCSTCDKNKQKDDGIFKGGAFSATSKSAGAYLNYTPGVIKGKEALVTKHARNADGGILAPTDIFVAPNPPSITTSAAGDGSELGDAINMHERELNDMLNGMKFKNTADVTGAEFYQKKVGATWMY